MLHVFRSFWMLSPYLFKLFQQLPSQPHSCHIWLSFLSVFSYPIQQFFSIVLIFLNEKKSNVNIEKIEEAQVKRVRHPQKPQKQKKFKYKTLSQTHVNILPSITRSLKSPRLIFPLILFSFQANSSLRLTKLVDIWNPADEQVSKPIRYLGPNHG